MGEGDGPQEWVPKGAAAKLAYIQSEMANVPKTGKHQQGYGYIQEHKVIEQLRPLLRKLHCAVVVEPARHVDVRDAPVFGKPGFLVTLTGVIRFIDTDEPADSADREIQAEVCGQGTDPGDKASGKAQTYLTKYALQKFFLIPTEAIDDADASAPSEPSRAGSESGRQKSEPKAKPRGGLLEYTRNAIRAKDRKLLSDEVWNKLVAEHTSATQKRELLETLNATYAQQGGDPVALRDAFDRQSA